MTAKGNAQRYTDAFLRVVEEGGVDPTECHLWPYSVAGAMGYAVVKWGPTLRKVSHLVLESDGRPRPQAPRNLALHSCDVPACINPAHLRWGTQSDNMRDRAIRTGWKRPRESSRS